MLCLVKAELLTILLGSSIINNDYIFNLMSKSIIFLHSTTFRGFGSSVGVYKCVILFIDDSVLQAVRNHSRIHTLEAQS